MRDQQAYPVIEHAGQAYLEVPSIRPGYCRGCAFNIITSGCYMEAPKRVRCEPTFQTIYIRPRKLKAYLIQRVTLKLGMS